MQSKLDLSKEHIDEFCRRWRVEELAVGRAERSPAADPGVRVKFEPSAEWSFSDRMRMEREFQLLSGREVRFRRPSRVAGSRRRQTLRVLYDA
ncbi:MAG TPA: hypothetical protein VFH95_01955 [Candidatus Kapabacteria bacterium]|nr:hypothetical protein [Candidatus Kapabacteria bacterium]